MLRIPRWHQDREFIAAQSRDGIGFAKQSPQAAGHFPQHHVADRMAERVVHIFEAVQIEQHHGERLDIALGDQQGLLEAVIKHCSIWQTGEMILKS